MASKRVPVEVKLQVVAASVALSVTQWAEKLNVSRETIYAWRRRYATEGVAGLEDRSRAPLRPAGKTPAVVAAQIIECRHALRAAGRDDGPDTIWSELRNQGVAVPSVSTVWRILARHGEIVPQPRKRPRPRSRRFQREYPNECWQIDATHYRLVNRTLVEVINIIDDRSRLCVASLAVTVCTSASAIQAFEFGHDRYGLPREVLSDNGRAFTSGPDQHPVVFEQRLIALSVQPIHARPYHPQTCGKVERFHQTQRRWLVAQPTARNIAGLQQRCEAFREFYNTIRTHRALNRHTPQSVFDELPKAGPEPLARATTPATISDRLVRDNGTLTIAGQRYIIGLGTAHAHQRVIVLRHDDHLTIADSTTGEIIRELDLDPTRRYQAAP